jgi:hypothetical protein
MFQLEYSKHMVSDGPMFMCAKLLKFRGGQVGRSLEATALCVVYVSWYSACVSIGKCFQSQPEDGHCKRPKHVVDLYIVNSIYTYLTTNKVVLD